MTSSGVPVFLGDDTDAIVAPSSDRTVAPPSTPPTEYAPLTGSQRDAFFAAHPPPPLRPKSPLASLTPEELQQIAEAYGVSR